MDDILTLEQKNRLSEILQKNPDATLTEITAFTYKNENIDSRSKEGRILKKYLLDNNIEYKNRSVFQRDRIQLTAEQEEFVKNNYKNQHYLDMAKILFKNNNLTHLSLESREVNKFVEKLQKKDPTYLEMATYVPKENETKNPNPLGEYFPPRRIDQTLYRINKYLNIGWEQNKLKAVQLKQVETLQRYMNTFSFCYQINTYKREDDRKLFEDAFIRYTYDKEDLTQEELDQFITLCTEAVTASTILQQVEDLRQLLRQASEEDEGRNIKMSLNEAISSLQTEYNQCRTRQNKLYKSLVDDRSKKMQDRKQENASILNLVQAWKDEEKRKSIINLAEAQKQNLEDEAKRLSSMDELKAVIRGIDIDEMVHS
jgi:hypothetical protein